METYYYVLLHRDGEQAAVTMETYYYGHLDGEQAAPRAARTAVH